MNFKNISNEGKIKQIKSKVDLINLKSNFIFQKLFGYMKKYKRLDIIKYNKKLQKRLKLNINDYKKYSELYSSIEIELKFVDNKWGKFVNILEEAKEYYHIYFDNSYKEIKRNTLKKSEQLKLLK